MQKEVKDAIEEVILDDVKTIQELPIDDESRREAIQNVVKLAEVVNTADQIDEKWVNDAAKLEFEERKASEANEIEIQKNRLTGGRAALEVTKAVAPIIAGSLISGVITWKMFKNGINWETTGGHPVSYFFKKVQLPRIGK